VTDESDLWTVVDEPSMEDFDAAEEEEPQAGARVVLIRILRVVGVLLVVLALVLYIVVPFYSSFWSVPYQWLRPNTGTHTIPLAPEHRSSPKRSA
jgi:hypothetical protein